MTLCLSQETRTCMVPTFILYHTHKLIWLLLFFICILICKIPSLHDILTGFIATLKATCVAVYKQECWSKEKQKVTQMAQPCIQSKKHHVNVYSIMGVFIQRNGTVEWNDGMEWNGIVEWPRPSRALFDDDCDWAVCFSLENPVLGSTNSLVLAD